MHGDLLEHSRLVAQKSGMQHQQSVTQSSTRLGGLTWLRSEVMNMYMPVMPVVRADKLGATDYTPPGGTLDKCHPDQVSHQEVCNPWV